MTKALRRTLKPPIELAEKLRELFPNFRAELEAGLWRRIIRSSDSWRL
jgi:hypothetical protein